MSTRDRSSDEFQRRALAIIGHELRTPLASLQAALGLLDQHRSELGEQTGELVAIARRNGDRLARLVEDILALQRFESSQTRFYPSPCSVGRMLEEAAAEQRATAAGENIEIELHDRAPEVRIRADQQHLLRALKQLLANAVHASPAGGTVTVRIEPVRDALRIVIRDAGTTRPTTAQRQLFDLGLWDDLPANHVGAGLGLGLRLARAIVVGMGGELTATSDGRGTTVTVALPLWREEEESARPAMISEAVAG